MIVSRPVIEGCRYDLIMDEGGILSKVQVKYTSGQSHGSVRIRVAPCDCRGKKGKVYTESEVDTIAVYSSVTDKLICYLNISGEVRK